MSFRVSRKFSCVSTSPSSPSTVGLPPDRPPGPQDRLGTSVDQVDRGETVESESMNDTRIFLVSLQNLLPGTVCFPRVSVTWKRYFPSSVSVWVGRWTTLVRTQSGHEEVISCIPWSYPGPTNSSSDQSSPL